MNGIIFENKALFEHRFWLQILGDHARFIFSSLSPREVQAIQIAQNFISAFDQLLAEARQPLAGVQLDALTQQAYNQVRELRVFKLDLLRRHLVEEIQIHLIPTFFNHMLNELEEYLLILDSLLAKNSRLYLARYTFTFSGSWTLLATCHFLSAIWMKLKNNLSGEAMILK